MIKHKQDKCRDAFERTLYPESSQYAMLKRKQDESGYAFADVDAEWITWQLAWWAALKSMEVRR